MIWKRPQDQRRWDDFILSEWKMHLGHIGSGPRIAAVDSASRAIGPEEGFRHSCDS